MSILLRRGACAIAALAALLLLAGGTCPAPQERPPDEMAEAPENVPADPEIPPIQVTDAAEAVAAAAESRFCGYRVLTAAGPRCGVYRQNALICVDCPSSATCPGPSSGRSLYEYRDAADRVLCSGEWVKVLNQIVPDGCIRCPDGGRSGFVFVED
ncbi:MAG TPA: hypothetical protein VHM02_02145 [Thermoanaerobaculia bacterium]|nr:hypothetical protein [Thermoanaerobaculia bacterium]